MRLPPLRGQREALMKNVGCRVFQPRVASMINVNLMVWLASGGMIGGLAVFENHFSMTALFASLVAVMVLLMIFGLVRDQPLR